MDKNVISAASHFKEAKAVNGRVYWDGPTYYRVLTYIVDYLKAEKLGAVSGRIILEKAQWERLDKKLRRDASTALGVRDIIKPPGVQALMKEMGLSYKDGFFIYAKEATAPTPAHKESAGERWSVVLRKKLVAACNAVKVRHNPMRITSALVILEKAQMDALTPVQRKNLTPAAVRKFFQHRKILQVLKDQGLVFINDHLLFSRSGNVQQERPVDETEVVQAGEEQVASEEAASTPETDTSLANILREGFQAILKELRGLRADLLEIRDDLDEQGNTVDSLVETTAALEGLFGVAPSKQGDLEVLPPQHPIRSSTVNVSVQVHQQDNLFRDLKQLPSHKDSDPRPKTLVFGIKEPGLSRFLAEYEDSYKMIPIPEGKLGGGPQPGLYVFVLTNLLENGMRQQLVAKYKKDGVTFVEAPSLFKLRDAINHL